MEYTPPIYGRVAPWSTHEEQMVSEALSIGDVPADVIRQTRPPLSQIVLFPPRFGYDQRVLGVADCFNGQITRYPDTQRIDDYSGGPAGYQAAARNVGGGTW